MILAVHLMPAFPSAEALEAFRLQHDPLATKISAHVTLMFPLEWTGELDFFMSHVIACASKVQPFELSLGPAEATTEGFVWLPVETGKETVTALHDQLYSGAFAIHQNMSHAYIPHVTIGRFPKNGANPMLKEASELQGVSEIITIHSMVVEEVRADESSRIVLEVALR